MKTKYTNKQIWMIAYPILISLLMEQMIGMTDTAFLGRVGEVELGASAIAGVFYMVIFMAAFGFSIGAQILISRYCFSPLRRAMSICAPMLKPKATMKMTM